MKASLKREKKYFSQFKAKYAVASLALETEILIQKEGQS